MLDLRQCKKNEKIKVYSSNTIFKELGNNNYDFIELISELIDNSITGRLDICQLFDYMDMVVLIEVS